MSLTLFVGETKTLQATVKVGTRVCGEDVQIQSTWSTSDHTKVKLYYGDGVTEVTGSPVQKVDRVLAVAVGVGSATITATNNTTSGTLTITVQAAPDSVTIQ